VSCAASGNKILYCGAVRGDVRSSAIVSGPGAALGSLQHDRASYDAAKANHD
jgi:hypothetical protein